MTALKSVKVETRQPLTSRTGSNGQTRPIAPVPHRTKTTVYPSSGPTHAESEDEFGMDVDHRRQDGIGKIEEEGSFGDISEEEEGDEDDEDDDWLRMSQEEAQGCEEQLSMIRSGFKDEVDMFDTTMVAEYADDIFAHMEELETSVMPNPRYMDFQTEIEW
jgi:hypothetical protein